MVNIILLIGQYIYITSVQISCDNAVTFKLGLSNTGTRIQKFQHRSNQIPKLDKMLRHPILTLSP